LHTNISLFASDCPANAAQIQVLLSSHEETQQQPVPEDSEADNGEVGFGEGEFAALDAGKKLLGD
jgi:hypothetical protein